MASNPGLKSRFTRFLQFDDYTGEQMLQIFESLAQRDGYELSPFAREVVEKYFTGAYENRDERFGNARLVRNFFEDTIGRQAMRLSRYANGANADDLRLILTEDIPGT
jgi:hypothetical protein